MDDGSEPLEDAIGVLAKAVAQVKGAVLHMRFDLDSPTDRFAVGLLLLIADYCQGIAACATAGVTASIAPLVRCSLDAYVDICNLCERPKYWEILRAADTYSWNKLLRSASHGKNLSLKPIAESDHFKELRSFYGKLERDFSDRGIEKPNIDDRFTWAGLYDAYEATYALLSAKAHNNVSGGPYRFTDMAAEPPTLRVEDPLASQATGEIVLSTEILLKSADKLLHYLGHGRAATAGAWRELQQLGTKLGFTVDG